jgi:hypothetical protein
VQALSIKDLTQTAKTKAIRFFTLWPLTEKQALSEHRSIKAGQNDQEYHFRGHHHNELSFNFNRSQLALFIATGSFASST